MRGRRRRREEKVLLYVKQSSLFFSCPPSPHAAIIQDTFSHAQALKATSPPSPTASKRAATFPTRSQTFTRASEERKRKIGRNDKGEKSQNKRVASLGRRRPPPVPQKSFQEVASSSSSSSSSYSFPSPIRIPDATIRLSAKEEEEEEEDPLFVEEELGGRQTNGGGRTANSSLLFPLSCFWTIWQAGGKSSSFLLFHFLLRLRRDLSHSGRGRGRRGRKEIREKGGGGGWGRDRERRRSRFILI